MEFFTTDLNGITLINPGESERRAVLQSVLEEPEADYPEVYLTVRDGPVIGYRPGGTLFMEEDGEIVRIIRGADLDAACRVWNLLVAGDNDALEALPWEPFDA